MRRRGRGVPPPRLRADPARAARERRRARRGPRGRRCRSWSRPARLRGDLHTHCDASDGKAHARGDGRGGARLRARVPRGHRPLGRRRPGHRARGRRPAPPRRARPRALAEPLREQGSCCSPAPRSTSWPTASLYYPDELLAELDWVVASLHVGAAAGPRPRDEAAAVGGRAPATWTCSATPRGA